MEKLKWRGKTTRPGEGSCSRERIEETKKPTSEEGRGLLTKGCNIDYGHSQRKPASGGYRNPNSMSIAAEETSGLNGNTTGIGGGGQPKKYGI